MSSQVKHSFLFLGDFFLILSESPKFVEWDVGPDDILHVLSEMLALMISYMCWVRSWS